MSTKYWVCKLILLQSATKYSFDRLTAHINKGNINKEFHLEKHMDSRTSKINYYLDIADSVSERSTCLRRKYGAIIVLNDEIISTGYNGAPRGRKNCSDLGRCTREELKIPSGQRYELCRSVHAEQNAIISASRRDMIGATIYLVGRSGKDDSLLSDAMCCSMCKRMIINAGISDVIIRVGENPEDIIQVDVQEWIDNDDSLFMDVGEVPV